MADYYSAAVGGRTTATKHNRLANFPEYFMIQLNRCAPPDYAFSGVHIAGKLEDPLEDLLFKILRSEIVACTKANIDVHQHLDQVV